MTNLMQVSHLSRRFSLGRKRHFFAVQDVSLNIKQNEVLGVVGESGSGKTTFGKMLVGLLDKTQGEVFYKGEPLPRQYKTADYKRYAGLMQMLFQNPYASLNPSMTVADVIGEGLRLKGERAAAIREQVASWLHKVGLSPNDMSRYPHEFSGGQRQRIGIARALVLAPEFVVCDEAVSALDVSVQAQIINLLRQLQSDMGLTLVFIAHDLSMVRFVSDRIAVFYMGKLVEIGDADAIYFHPLHPYSQLLVQSVPLARSSKNSVAAVPELIATEAASEPALDGCNFADRCPEVMPICRQQVPQLQDKSDKRASSDYHADRPRQVACHARLPASA